MEKCKNKKCDNIVVNKRNKFCCSSCAASHNNIGIRRHPQNRCIKCGEKTNNAKFCGSSCAAKYNNRGKRKHGNPPEYVCCVQCDKSILQNYTKTRKYCNSECQKTYRFLTVKLVQFLEETLNHKGSVKKCFIYLYGNVCAECKNAGIHNNKALVLQMDHIDGNSDNNKKENLQLLCPNCHSQTESYCGKRAAYKTDTRNVYRRKWYEKNRKSATG